MEKIKIKSADGLLLDASHFPVDNPVGIVQIIHGAKEHKARYYHFATFLQKNKLAVIVSDNRGHGGSVNESYPLGFMNAVDEIVADQVLVTNYIKKKYPNKPLYLLGHSLGSVFARCYIQKHDSEVEKLILSGTVNHVAAVDLGILLGKAIINLSGKYGFNAFLERLSLKNQKGDSWISVSERNLGAYRRDPLCQFDYRNQAVVTIFQAVARLKQYSCYKCNRPDLAILSISGDGDPITGGQKGLNDSLYTLKRAGYHNIDHIVYSNMNHEVLNEDNNELVYEDVLEFLLNGVK